MKTICLLFLLSILFWANSIHADINHLASDHRKLLINVVTFRLIKDSNNIPSAVLALCSDSNGRLAAPGKPWEATDIITNPKLPWKRLIWSATYKNYYLIHYERGGRGHSFHILLAQTKGGKAEALWRATGVRYANTAAFLKALQENQLYDDPKYAH
jgi:hypothetical protein